MLLIAAGASLMRGERYVHEDAPTPESPAEALVRESAALDPAPGADVAYEDAVRLETSTSRTSSSSTNP
jgi:hypothetical protein